MSPLILTLLKGAAPYALAAIAGFALAFGIQELRITSAEQEFTQYKQDQTTQRQEAKDAADLQRLGASLAYASASKQVANEIDAGEIYRRCVAAGKCRVQQHSACPASGLPTAERIDGARPEPVPAGAGYAAINDCARTTLMLNKLQTDIEAQPGFKE